MLVDPRTSMEDKQWLAWYVIKKGLSNTILIFPPKIMDIIFFLIFFKVRDPHYRHCLSGSPGGFSLAKLWLRRHEISVAVLARHGQLLWTNCEAKVIFTAHAVIVTAAVNNSNSLKHSALVKHYAFKESFLLKY